MEKMTYVSALSVAIDQLHDDSAFDEVCEKLRALQDSLTRKSATKASKPSKAQVESAAFAEQVYAQLSDTPVQCGAIAKELDASTQKVSAALRKLVSEGRAEKSVEKGVSYFVAMA